MEINQNIINHYLCTIVKIFDLINIFHPNEVKDKKKTAVD